MKDQDLIFIVRKFFPESSDEEINISVITSGLINQTFKVRIGKEEKYVLQQLNSNIFKHPERVQNNIYKVAEHLSEHDYDKSIIYPIKTEKGLFFYKSEEKNYWRMFSFINNTDCHEVSPSLPFILNASKSLCEFHSILSNFDAKKLQDSLPDFLNFQLRYNQFQEALLKGSQERVMEAEMEISVINSFIYILEEFYIIQNNLPQRIIHADPKISNFLFGKDSSEVIAIIDWDTLMKGTVLYDFGEMIRSHTNTKAEDDASGNNFDAEKFEAINKIFESESSLLEIEKNNLYLGAKLVILVQAIRFLTDYILGNKYYQTSYSSQNLNRAKGQLNLLNDLVKYESQKA